MVVRTKLLAMHVIVMAPYIPSRSLSVSRQMGSEVPPHISLKGLSGGRQLDLKCMRNNIY